MDFERWGQRLMIHECCIGIWKTKDLLYYYSLQGGGLVSQPHFEKSVRMKLTLPKWELGSPSGLPKLQSAIARAKTPHIGAFFILLERYRSVDVENELA